MKRKVVALGLAVMLCLSTSLTAFADSPDTENNSGDQATTETPAPTTSSNGVATSVEAAAPGQAVAPQAVSVAVASNDGTVSVVSLDDVVETASNTVIAAAAATPANAVAAVESLLTAPVSEMFTKTVEALATIKGSDMVINNCGTVKTAATAKDAFGNTIASAGVIKNVTSGALIMLMSVNADGTVEYVEGVVDPVTGAVVGAFQGTPSVITVLVLA